MVDRNPLRRSTDHPGRHGLQHAETVATPEPRWQPYREDSTVIKELRTGLRPRRKCWPWYRELLRYVVIRIRKKQSALFCRQQW
jgi:hypothetical protein